MATTMFDLDDDLLILRMGKAKSNAMIFDQSLDSSHLDTFEEENIRCSTTFDLSSLDSPLPNSLPSINTDQKKMSDIADLLDSSVLHDDDDDSDTIPSLSTNLVDYFRSSYRLPADSNSHESYQWQLEENYLRFGEKCSIFISTDRRSTLCIVFDRLKTIVAQ
jgi:hypothetical protein